MKDLLIFLVVVAIIVAVFGRRLWDKDYREGMRARREHESWSAGWEKGGSGCAMVILMVVGVGSLLVVLCVSP